MNVDEMPAGREIDRLVAEKVMEWEFHANAGWYKKGMWESNPSCKSAKCSWSPSFDISAAWEVVEKLRELTAARKLWGPNLKLKIPISVGDNPRWCLELYDDTYGGMAEPHTHYTKWIAWAETAPLAICRAALKAVGG